MNITSAICMEKVSSSQKPPPHASSTAGGVVPTQPRASAMVSRVRSTAMAKALGTKRAEKRPRPSANRTRVSTVRALPGGQRAPA